MQIIAESEQMVETFSIVTIHSTFFFSISSFLFFLFVCSIFLHNNLRFSFFFFTQIGTYIYCGYCSISFDHVDLVIYQTFNTIFFLTSFYSNTFSNVPLSFSLSPCIILSLSIISCSLYTVLKML